MLNINILRVNVALNDDVTIESVYLMLETLSKNLNFKLITYKYKHICDNKVNTTVMGLASLGDVRRLLRRQLPATLCTKSKLQLAAAIREAEIHASLRIRELSDLRDWDVVTAEELERITAEES